MTRRRSRCYKESCEAKEILSKGLGLFAMGIFSVMKYTDGDTSIYLSSEACEANAEALPGSPLSLLAYTVARPKYIFKIEVVRVYIVFGRFVCFA
jgi:hypothetical protein